jgi:histone H3/H4
MNEVTFCSIADEEMQVVRISGDGLKAVAKAAELMVADMAAKSCVIAQGQKRNTIKLCDVEQTGDIFSPSTATA